MFGDEFEYSVQDTLAGVDNFIRELNTWWAEHGTQWMEYLQYVGGPVGGAATGMLAGQQAFGSSFPVPPFALPTYQLLFGYNPRADEASLTALAQYWADEASRTGERIQQVVDAARNVQILWLGDGAPQVFQQQVGEWAGSASSLLETQAELAMGVTEFAVEVIQAKAAYRAQVALMLSELFVYLLSAVPTWGASLVLAGARMLVRVGGIRVAMRQFIQRLRQVSFQNRLQQMTMRTPGIGGLGSRPRVLDVRPGPLRNAVLGNLQDVGGRAMYGVEAGLRRAGRGALFGAGRGLRAVGREFRPTGFRPSAIAARRAAPNVQRQWVEQVKQAGGGIAERAAANSVAAGQVAERALRLRLGGRAPVSVDDLPASLTSRLPRSDVESIVNLANRAVDSGVTTWGTLGQAVLGYGGRSALQFGATGWLIQESATGIAAANLGIEGYQPNVAGLATSVVGAGLGGAPLAFGTRMPEMAVLGGVGGALGYYGSMGTELLLNPDMDLQQMLRAGGADNLTEAILQGALGGAIWERHIGQASLADARMAVSDFGHTWNNVSLDSLNSGTMSAGTLSAINDASVPAQTLGSSGQAPGVVSPAAGAPAGAGAPPGAQAGAGSNSPAGGGGRAGSGADSSSAPVSPSGEAESGRGHHQSTSAAPSTGQSAAPEAPSEPVGSPDAGQAAVPGPEGGAEQASPPGPDASPESPVAPERPAATAAEGNGAADAGDAGAEVSRSETASATASDQGATASDQGAAAEPSSPQVGEVHRTEEHLQQSPPPAPGEVTVPPGEREALATGIKERIEQEQQLAEQLAEAERKSQEAQKGNFRKVLDTLTGGGGRPDSGESPVRNWSQDKLETAIEQVALQANESSDPAIWKPTADGGRLVQGRYDGASFILQVGQDGAVQAAWAGEFSTGVTNAAVAAASAGPSGPPMTSAKRALAVLLERLQQQGAVIVDEANGVFTMRLPSGSYVRVRWAVDPNLPEGQWYVGPAQYEFTNAGWLQVGEVTVVLSGEVRADLAELARDVGNQVQQALAKLDQDVPGPIGENSVRDDSGRASATDGAEVGDVQRTLPTLVRPQPSDPAAIPQPPAQDAADRLVGAVSEIQAGRMPSDVQAEDGHPYVAISGDPAEGVKLAHHADGTTTTFTIEAKPGADNTVRVIPGEWWFDGQRWRQISPARIEVSTALTGDLGSRQAQMAAMVDAGLRELHRTQPGTDLAQTTTNRLALAEARRLQEGGPVTVSPEDARTGAEPADRMGQFTGQVPTERGVLLSLGDREVFVRFAFAPGKSGDPTITLPKLRERGGEVWQMSDVTITLPGRSEATWASSEVQAALGKLYELLGPVGPLHTGALQLLRSPQSGTLADNVQQAALPPKDQERAYLLPDPLSAAADPSVGPSTAGPDGHPPDRYVVRLPGQADVAAEAQALLTALTRDGYRFAEIVNSWSEHGVPGLLVRGFAPPAKGQPGTGQPIELRLLDSDGAAARDAVARQGEQARLSQSEVLELLNVGGAGPQSLDNVQIPRATPPKQAGSAAAAPERAPEWTVREPGWPDEGNPARAGYLPPGGDPAAVHEQVGDGVSGGDLVVLATGPPDESVVDAHQQAAVAVVRVMEAVAHRSGARAENRKAVSDELIAATREAHSAAVRIHAASADLAAARARGDHAEVAQAYARWREAVARGEAMLADAGKAMRLAGEAGLGRLKGAKSLGRTIRAGVDPLVPAEEQVAAARQLARQLAEQHGVRVLVHESNADGTATRSRITPDGQRYGAVVNLDQLLVVADAEGVPAADVLLPGTSTDAPILLDSDPRRALRQQYRDLARYVGELANELERVGFGTPNQQVVAAAREWVRSVRTADVSTLADQAPGVLADLLAEERRLREHGAQLERSVERLPAPQPRPGPDLARQAQAIADATGNTVVLQVTDDGETSRRRFSPTPGAARDAPAAGDQHPDGPQPAAPREVRYPVNGPTRPGADALVVEVAQRILQRATTGVLPGVDRAVMLPDGSVRLIYGDASVVTRVEPDADLPPGVAQVRAGVIKVSSQVPIGSAASLVVGEVLRRALDSLGAAARGGATLAPASGDQWNLSRLLAEAATGGEDAVNQVVETLRGARPGSDRPAGLVLHTGDPVAEQDAFAAQLEQAMSELEQAAAEPEQEPASSEAAAAQRATELRERAAAIQQYGRELQQAQERVRKREQALAEARKGRARSAARTALRAAQRELTAALAQWQTDRAAGGDLLAEATSLAQELGDAVPASLGALLRWLPPPTPHPGPNAAATAGRIARGLGEAVTLEVAEADGGRTRYEIDADGNVARTVRLPPEAVGRPEPVALERLVADASEHSGAELVAAAGAAFGEQVQPGGLVRMTADPTGAWLRDLPGAAGQLEQLLTEAWEHIRAESERSTSSGAVAAAGEAFAAAGEAWQFADAIRDRSETLRQAREDLRAAQQAVGNAAPDAAIAAYAAEEQARLQAERALLQWQNAMLDGQLMLSQVETVTQHLPEHLRTALGVAAERIQLANPFPGVDAAQEIAAGLGVRVELTFVEADGTVTVHRIDIDGQLAQSAPAAGDQAASARLAEAVEVAGEPVADGEALADVRDEVATLAEEHAATVALALGFTVSAANAQDMIRELLESMEVMRDEADPGVRAKLVWGPEGRPRFEVRLGDEVTVAHLAAAVLHEATHALQGRPVNLSQADVVRREEQAHQAEWLFYRSLNRQAAPGSLASEIHEVATWSDDTVRQVARQVQAARADYRHSLAGLPADAVAEVTSHSGEGAASEGDGTGPVQEIGRLMGVPMEALPYVHELAEQLNRQFQELGVDAEVTPFELNEMLLDKYRNVVSDEGFVYTFGRQNPQQFHIRLDLSEPRKVLSQIKGHEQIQSNMGQGFWGRVATAVRSGHVFQEFNSNVLWLATLGMTPTTRARFHAATGQHFDVRQFAEVSFGVAANRGAANPTEFEAAFHVTALDPGTSRSSGQPATFTVSEQQAGHRDTLLLAVPDIYYGNVEQATTKEGDLPPASHLPHRMVLDMGGKEEMLQLITDGLAEAGVPVTEGVREQIRGHLWALDATFSTTEKSRHGYHIPIWRDNQVVAYVRHTLTPDRASARPVGRPSDEFRIEQVGVAQHRVGGESSIASGRERALGYGVPATATVDGSRPRTESSGAASDNTTFRVKVDKDREAVQTHLWQGEDGQGGVRHEFTIVQADGTGRQHREMTGTMVTLMSEAAAYRYGVPVSNEAFVRDAAGNIEVNEHGAPLLRGEPRRPQVDDPADLPAYPDLLTADDGDGGKRGLGAGVGMVRDLRLWSEDGGRDPMDVTGYALFEELTGRLAQTGLLPDEEYLARNAPQQEDPAKWRRSARALQMYNLLMLERQLSAASLQTRFDELAQGSIDLVLLRLAPWSYRVEEYQVTVSLRQKLDETTFKGYTTGSDDVHLIIDSSAVGVPESRSTTAVFGGNAGLLGVVGGRLFGAWTRSAGITNAARHNNVKLFEHSPSTDPAREGTADESATTLGVWNAPFTLTVAVSGGPALTEFSFALQGDAEVRLPASFIHSSAPPQPVAGQPLSERGTPTELFDYNTAVITSVNAIGLKEAAWALLNRMRTRWSAAGGGPAYALRQFVSTLTGVDMMMARFPDVLVDDGARRSGGVRSDHLFEAGVGPHTRFGVKVSARPQGTEFLGVAEVATTGHFTFRLASMFANFARSPSFGAAGNLLLGLGGYGREKSTAETNGRIFGRERLPLSFEQRRFHLRTYLDYRVDVSAGRGGGSRRDQDTVSGGWVTWVLAESDAMDAYAKGLLDLPEQEVATSLQRWREGDLMLKRTVAAQAAKRLAEQSATPSGDTPHLPLLDHVLDQYDASERDSLPRDADLATVLSEIDRLVENYPHAPPAELARRLPEYLRRQHRRGLGFSAIEFLDLLSVRESGSELELARANERLREMVEEISGGALRGIVDQEAAPVGRVPGLGSGLDAEAVEHGLRAGMDSMLDGTDGHIIASADVPLSVQHPWLSKHLPRFAQRLERFPWLTERVEVVARARIVGEPTITGERVDGTEQQDYRYRQQITSGGRSRSLEAGATGLLVLGGVATDRGWSQTTSIDQQRTTIRTQTDWHGQYTAEAPVEIVFEVRRYGPRGHPIWNRLAAALSVTDRRPHSREMSFSYNLGVQLPKAVVTAPSETVMSPDRRNGWRDLRRIRRLPSRFGADLVEGQPLREGMLETLTRALGKRHATALRHAVHNQLSADANPSNLDRMASESGYDVLPGVHLPDEPSTSVDATVNLSFAVESTRKVPAGAGTGIIQRYQWLARGEAGRSRMLPLSTEADPTGWWSELLGYKFGGTDQAGMSDTAQLGQRREMTSKETGPEVEVRLRYTASFEVRTYQERGNGVRFESLDRRATRTGHDHGYVYIRIYERDLPELLRRIEAAQPWDPATEAGAPWTQWATAFPGEDGVHDPGVLRLLNTLREKHAPTVSADEVLDRAAAADGLDSDLPGPAVASALREAAPPTRHRAWGVPHAAPGGSEPGGLVYLTADPVKSAYQVAEQVRLAMAKASETATEALADSDLPSERVARWSDVLSSTASAGVIAEEAAVAAWTLRWTRVELAQAEAELPRRGQPAAAEAQQRLHQAREGFAQAHEHWQSVREHLDRMLEDAVAVERALNELTGGTETPIASQVANRPYQDMDLLKLFREAGWELGIELVLRVTEPDGTVTPYRLAPDGMWYRDDPDRGLTHALDSLGPALLDRAQRLRLDLPAWYERARQMGRPLADVIAEATHPEAARAARVGVDVDRALADAAGQPADAAATLVERAEHARAGWVQHQPGFHQALRDAGFTDAQLAQVMVHGRDLLELYRDTRPNDETEPDGFAAALSALLAEDAAVPRPSSEAELAQLFGFDSTSPGERDSFRGLLADAGLDRLGRREAALLYELAGEMALRHGLFAPAQRRLLLEVDPSWLAAAVALRPSQVRAIDVVNPAAAPAADQQRLLETVDLIVERYYRNMPMDRHSRGAHPISDAQREQVRAAVEQWGVSYAAWVAAHLPDSRFEADRFESDLAERSMPVILGEDARPGQSSQSDVAEQSESVVPDGENAIPRQFSQEVNDPNTPSPAQYKWLDGTGRRTRWVASGADGVFAALYHALPADQQQRLAAELGVANSEAEVPTRLRERLADELEADHQLPPAQRRLWPLAPELRSDHQRLAAVRALREDGAVGDPFYQRLPALLAEQYRLEIDVRDANNAPANYRSEAPVGQATLLRTGDHHMPVLPEPSGNQPGPPPAKMSPAAVAHKEAVDDLQTAEQRHRQHHAEQVVPLLRELGITEAELRNELSRADPDDPRWELLRQVSDEAARLQDAVGLARERVRLTAARRVLADQHGFHDRDVLLGIFGDEQVPGQLEVVAFDGRRLMVLQTTPGGKLGELSPGTSAYLAYQLAHDSRLHDRLADRPELLAALREAAEQGRLQVDYQQLAGHLEDPTHTKRLDGDLDLAEFAANLPPSPILLYSDPVGAALDRLAETVRRLVPVAAEAREAARAALAGPPEPGAAEAARAARAAADRALTAADRILAAGEALREARERLQEAGAAFRVVPDLRGADRALAAEQKAQRHAAAALEDWKRAVGWRQGMEPARTLLADVRAAEQLVRDRLGQELTSTAEQLAIDDPIAPADPLQEASDLAQARSTRVQLVNTAADGSRTRHRFDPTGDPTADAPSALVEVSAESGLADAVNLATVPVMSTAGLDGLRNQIEELALAHASVNAELLAAGADAAAIRQVIQELVGSMRRLTVAADGGVRARLVWPDGPGKPRFEVRMGSDVTVAHLVAAVVHEATHVLQGRPVELSPEQVVGRERQAHRAELEFYQWLQAYGGEAALPDRDIRTVVHWTPGDVDFVVDWVHTAERQDYVHSLAGLAGHEAAEQHSHTGSGEATPTPPDAGRSRSVPQPQPQRADAVRAFNNWLSDYFLSRGSRADDAGANEVVSATPVGQDHPIDSVVWSVIFGDGSRTEVRFTLTEVSRGRLAEQTDQDGRPVIEVPAPPEQNRLITAAVDIGKPLAQVHAQQPAGDPQPPPARVPGDVVESPPVPGEGDAGDTSWTATELPGAPGGRDPSDPDGIRAAVDRALEGVAAKFDAVLTWDEAGRPVLSPAGAEYALRFTTGHLFEDLRGQRRLTDEYLPDGRRVIEVTVSDRIPVGDELGEGWTQRDIWVRRVVVHEISEQAALAAGGHVARMRGLASAELAGQLPAADAASSAHHAAHRAEAADLAEWIAELRTRGQQAPAMESVAVEIGRQLDQLQDLIAQAERAASSPVSAGAEPGVPLPPLTPELTESRYGIPRRNQVAFQDYADRAGLVIDVRPTNPDSVRWLEQGALPKPRSIKAKTVNDYDLLLNAELPRDSKGLVALFEPRLPARETTDLTDGQWAVLEERYRARTREWHKLRSTIGTGAAGDSFRLRGDGIVEARDTGGQWGQITGDHDIFDIRRSDGSRPELEEELLIIDHMRERQMAVAHGALVNWQPVSAFEREHVREPLLAQHREGGEPLVRFAPGQPPRLVWADTPV